MKATRWYGTHDIRVENVPDPSIQDARDAIIRITSTAICGSDLHIYDGFIPTMEKGDILGHEFMGVVEEVGKQNGLKKGDRVVIPFQISCGECYFCKRMQTALCDRSNHEGLEKMEKVYGQAAAGLFGYSHMYGGYPGGQAEYARVPYADFGAFKVLRNSPTTRYFSSLIFSQPVSWPPKIAISSRARLSPCGAAVPSGSLLSAALFSSVRAA